MAPAAALCSLSGGSAAVTRGTPEVTTPFLERTAREAPTRRPLKVLTL